MLVLLLTVRVYILRSRECYRLLYHFSRALLRCLFAAVRVFVDSVDVRRWAVERLLILSEGSLLGKRLRRVIVQAVSARRRVIRKRRRLRWLLVRKSGSVLLLVIGMR